MAISGKIIKDSSSNTSTKPIYLNSNGVLTDVSITSWFKRGEKEFSAINSENGCTVTSSTLLLEGETGPGHPNWYEYDIPLPYTLTSNSLWMLFIIIGSTTSSSNALWRLMIGKGLGSPEIILGGTSTGYLQDDIYYNADNDWVGYYSYSGGSTSNLTSGPPHIRISANALNVSQVGTYGFIRADDRTRLRLLSIQI